MRPHYLKSKQDLLYLLGFFWLFKINSPTAVEPLEPEEDEEPEDEEPEPEDAGAVVVVVVVVKTRLGKVGLGVVNPSFNAVTRGPTISPRKLPNADAHGSAKFRRTGWTIVSLKNESST